MPTSGRINSLLVPLCCHQIPAHTPEPPGPHRRHCYGRGRRLSEGGATWLPLGKPVGGIGSEGGEGQGTLESPLRPRPPLPFLLGSLPSGGDEEAQAQFHRSCPSGSHAPQALKGQKQLIQLQPFRTFVGAGGRRRAGAVEALCGVGSGRVSSCSLSRQKQPGRRGSRLHFATHYINWKRKVCELGPQVWGDPGLRRGVTEEARWR